ncbi:MAG: hypothetical protein MJZ16_07710 [Bacteroidales bacterium]|nr:hypothetical protein [Bacteroidales bacterium]
MEEKKLNEMESLELITRMIDQTKKETAIGSGNVFLVWGYLCTFMSLVVCAMTFMTRKSGWGWLYIAIPFLGFLIAGLVARKTSKKYNSQATYQAKSIGSIWGILSAIFGAYAGICIITSVFHSAAVNVWSGMFLLGLLLPGIGTYATGVILKEDSVRMCGFIGCLFGLFFLKDFCNGSAITLYWAVLMAVAMVISLVIPGHILNNKAKKANS